MMTTTPPNSVHEIEANNQNGEKVSTFRRVLPQFLGACAKGVLVLNIGEFAAFPSIVIPSLIGMSKHLNPDESVQVTAEQTSWLSSSAHLVHPIGSLLSGPINDKIGRRKAIMMVCIPIAFAWLMMGFSYSFPVICFGFILIGFCFGLKEAPSVTYVAEISEPTFRGMMITISIFAYNTGIFIVLGFGSILSWRQVSLICSLFPISCWIAILLVPESPTWLLSKNRPKDAQKALQWLRGCVSPQTIHTEFTELQQFSNKSHACLACSQQSHRCYHVQQSFFDKIIEIKRKRNLKPCLLLFCLQFFNEFCGFAVWQPYIVQVLNALGTPIDPNLTTVIASGLGIVASIFLISTVRRFGRRKIYLTSSAVLASCCFGLSIYGFVLLPSGWMSFKESPNDAIENPKFIRQHVGNYSYFAFALVLIMQFSAKIGVAGMPNMFIGEVFPFKSRSFLCGIATANHYILAAIATKTYYNIEMWLSLPGAILLYGWISVFGFIVMYLIMPETEQRSLEDIELHYSDNTKGITDIDIGRHNKVAQ